MISMQRKKKKKQKRKMTSDAFVTLVADGGGEEEGRALEEGRELAGLDEVEGGLVVERGGDDEGGALGLEDGVDVVDDEGVRDRLVEGVGRDHDDVELGVRQRQGAAARERVQQIKGLALFAGEVLRSEIGGAFLRNDRVLALPIPDVARLDRGRPELRVGVERLEVRVELLRNRRQVQALHRLELLLRHRLFSLLLLLFLLRLLLLLLRRWCRRRLHSSAASGSASRSEAHRCHPRRGHSSHAHGCSFARFEAAFLHLHRVADASSAAERRNALLYAAAVVAKESF
mmetsp:Transcript_17394/g.52967  ORF Transcript_17394/g.52967 Transcript_17394/m.52967 type:complete len:287 (-) Transcript_17394:1976-2836(-)